MEKNVTISSSRKEEGPGPDGSMVAKEVSTMTKSTTTANGTTCATVSTTTTSMASSSVSSSSEMKAEDQMVVSASDDEVPITLLSKNWPLLSTSHKLSESEAKEAVERLRQILRFPTVSATAASDGQYTKCATWIKNTLKDIGCFETVDFLNESPSNMPVVVARWKGKDSKLPVILLNSHYDVVPADPEAWTVPPFDALVKDDKIFGRGAQDMKCVCIQYMEAIRKLHSVGFQPSRDVYLTYVPDEEVGGGGMAAFLESETYKNLPGIALALDEGLASTTDTFNVFYGERMPWFIEVKAEGRTGHGSRFIEHTAVEQLLELCQRALEFRKGQRAVLHGDSKIEQHVNCSHAVVAAKRAKRTPRKLGDVTSLNITTLEAGVRVADTFAYNVVPPIAKASMDIRIPPHTPPDEVRTILNAWCQECSTSEGSLSWSFLMGQGQYDDSNDHCTTSTDPKINPWYKVFASTLDEMKVPFQPEIFPAASDSRFLRALGVRALGFSPMRSCEIMLHENDEYIDIPVFLEGLGIMTAIIQQLARQGPEIDTAS